MPALPPELSIEDIQSAVERHCKVGHLELISARRTAGIVRPRQIAMFLAKNLTSNSLPVIGREFGGRDHTTVLHAVRKIEALRRRDENLARDLDAIIRAIAPQPA
jgi:chromosomal replication initiator protein